MILRPLCRFTGMGERKLVGLGGLEPPTSPLSGARSSHLSYRPVNTAWENASNYFILRCPWFLRNRHKPASFAFFGPWHRIYNRASKHDTMSLAELTDCGRSYGTQKAFRGAVLTVFDGLFLPRQSPDRDACLD